MGLLVVLSDDLHLWDLELPKLTPQEPAAFSVPGAVVGAQPARLDIILTSGI